MADDADRASEQYEQFNEWAVTEAARRAMAIPKGVAGDCDLCGEWSGRLVGEVCAPCRDRYKLD